MTLRFRIVPILNSYLHATICGTVRTPINVNLTRLYSQVKSTRVVFSDHSRPGKLYEHHENEFAHKVLEDNSYSVLDLSSVNSSVLLNVEGTKEINDLLTTVPLQSLTVNELVDIFKKVSVDVHLRPSRSISEPEFDGLCSAIEAKASEMSDDQLKDVLNYLRLWPMAESAREHNFFKVWRAIDEQCKDRRKVWNYDKMLYFIDLWYSLRLARMSDFVYFSVTTMGKKAHLLTHAQLVQTLFYLNVLRTAHKGLTMYNLEHRLEQIIHELSIEEIGVACMGFFKTRSMMRSEKLLNYILIRVMNEIEKIPDISLACIVKLIRYSLPISLWHRIPVLLDTIYPHLDRANIQTCMHVNLVTTHSQTYHPKTLNKVTQMLVDNIKQARLKDIEKVLYPLALFHHEPISKPCIFTAVAEELKRPEREVELQSFPKCFVAVVHYLCLRSVFIPDLIARVLDMNFIRSTYGKTNYAISRETLCIDTLVDLMYPEYKGPKLDQELRNYLSRRYAWFIPTNKATSKQNLFFVDVLETAKRRFGEKCVASKYIVPHHARADIIVGTDADGHLLPIPEELSSVPDFSGAIRAPSNGSWFALVPCGRNMLFSNTREPNGETVAKCKILSILGFVPKVINVYNWPEGDGEQDKNAFLADLLLSKKS